MRSKFKTYNPFWQVLAIGVLAGMRTTAAPVIASQLLSRHPSKNLEKSPLKFMQSKIVANTLMVLSLGEVIGDKLPTTPNRIAPAGLTGRSLAGSLAGASIYKAIGGNAYTGALLGASSAAAATFGSFYLRKFVVKSTKIPDPVVGGIEDALVVSAGVGLIISA